MGAKAPTFLVIIFVKSYNDYEYPISFDELRRRFPHTSFCDPIQQSALPEGYVLANVKEKPETLKSLKPVLFFENGFPWINWEYEKTNDEERDELQTKVLSEIERLTKETDWAVRDEVPDFIKNKYKEYRNKLWKIPEQENYPFMVVYPEIE